MADKTTSTSSSGSSSSSITSSSSSSSSSGNSSVSSEIQRHLLSSDECAVLFDAEPVANLDLYLFDRCGNGDYVKIPAAAMDDSGVAFGFNFEGDVLASASPSNDYYRMTNATVTTAFTLRWHLILDQIKSIILPGQITETNGKKKQSITRQILRRRPKSFVLLAVGENEPPDPTQAAGGSLVFPNVSLDFGNAINLNYNPNDPLELESNLIARFSEGTNGVLAEIWY